MFIESVMPSNHLILCRPLLLLPSVFPSIGSLPVSQLFTSGGQSTGASASASVLPVNTQDCSPLGWTACPSCCPRASQASSPTPQLQAPVLWCSAFFMVQISHTYMATGKAIGLTRQTFVGNVTSLPFNMLSRFVIALLPRSLNFMTAVTIHSNSGDQAQKICHQFFPFHLP